MRNRYTFVLLILVPLTIHSQSDPGVYSARAFGMAGVGVTLDGIDAAYFNPAGLTSLAGTSLHGGSGRSFGLSPLTQANAAGAVRTGKENFFFARLSQFGFASYQERLIGVGYAMQLEKRMRFAARFDVYQIGIEGYGTAFLPGFSIGMQYYVGNHLRLGACIQNPVEISTHEAITLPVKIAAGASYHPSEHVGVYFEVEKDIDFDPRVKVAVEYRIIDVLFLRAGLAGNPGSFHSGVGLLVRDKLRIDIGTGYHPQLGFTPVLGLAYTDTRSRS